VQGTVLFVGSGRGAIRRADELGLHVVVAPELDDVEALLELAHREPIDGLVTSPDDPAVSLVATAAEALGLPGIGIETAHLLTNKIAMRRRFAEQGVAQPSFAGVRALQDARAGFETVGAPSVLKPADSSDPRGVFRLTSVDDLEAHLHAALAASVEGEAIVESFHDGLALNALAIVRDGEARLLTLFDRPHPWAHVYPSTLFADVLELAESTIVGALHALGLQNGVAFLELVVSGDADVRVVDVAAGMPGAHTAELVRHAIGVDVIEIALLQALGQHIPDALVEPQFSQPVAMKFLAVEAGRVHSVGTLDKVLAFPGVVGANVFVEPGETVSEDRRGYVIAVADTNLEALERSEAAATLVDVVVE
jgi:biotin carboxylase